MLAGCQLELLELRGEGPKQGPKLTWQTVPFCLASMAEVSRGSNFTSLPLNHLLIGLIYSP